MPSTTKTYANKYLTKPIVWQVCTGVHTRVICDVTDVIENIINNAHAAQLDTYIWCGVWSVVEEDVRNILLTATHNAVELDNLGPPPNAP